MKKDFETRISEAETLTDVLLLLKESTLLDTHVSTLAYLTNKVEEFNGKYGIYECRPFPLKEKQEVYNLQAYYFNPSLDNLSSGDIVLVVFTDKNFINNLYSNDETPKETQDQGNHLLKYGVIIPINGKEIQEGKFVRYDINTQPLTNNEKENARTNIGAGTSNFSGDYTDLSNRPNFGDLAFKDEQELEIRMDQIDFPEYKVRLKGFDENPNHPVDGFVYFLPPLANEEWQEIVDGDNFLSDSYLFDTIIILDFDNQSGNVDHYSIKSLYEDLVLRLTWVSSSLNSISKIIHLDLNSSARVDYISNYEEVYIEIMHSSDQGEIMEISVYGVDIT